MSYQSASFYQRIDVQQDVPIPLPVYEGPGDIVADAFAWWGLRAYSNGAMGANAVRIRRVSDNAEQNFVTLADGSLDVASVATFLSATSGRIVTLYDQTGNGRNVTQSTAANQPEYTPNGIGSLPTITFTAASVYFLTNTSWPSFSQPFTFSMVFRPGSLSNRRMLCITSNDIELYEDGSAVGMYAGGVLSLAASNSTWYGVVAVYDGAGSDIYLNANSSTGNAGAGVSVGTTTLAFGALDVAGSFPSEGKIPEGGIWASGFSGTQAADLIANKQAYWGY